jgi:hypothetical protein
MKDKTLAEGRLINLEKEMRDSRHAREIMAYSDRIAELNQKNRSQVTPRDHFSNYIQSVFSLQKL